MPLSSGNITKVLVVDDSAFMRKAISIMLESDPQIKVIGQARDGEEAIEKVRQLKPDLVTLDVEMPRMDGLAALQQIMKTDPVPVMMISSITTAGAEATLEALELGAIDFIPKQMSYVSLDIVKIKEELLAKIKDIAKRKHLLMAQYRQRQFSHARNAAAAATGKVPAVATPAPPIPSIRKRNHAINIVAVGSSTGGPPALSTLFAKLPAKLPVGVVVAQHMPAQFTKSLADRLDALCSLTIREAVDGDRIEPGLVLIAPGGLNMTVKRRGGDAIVSVSPEPVSTLYKPCVDVLMNSVADSFGETTLGVILTGMGNNGVHGFRNVKGRGGVVVAQNEQTCVVYGMPRAVIEAGLADHVAGIDDIPAEIASYF